MHHHPQSEKIELTSDEFEKIESEVQVSNLSPKTKELILKALHFIVWLQRSLEHAKLSIKKLQKLFDIIPRRGRIRKKKNLLDSLGTDSDLNTDSNAASVVNKSSANIP